MNRSKSKGCMSRKSKERMIYIAVILLLLLYGLLKDSEAAARLLEAVTNAFSILIQNP